MNGLVDEVGRALIPLVIRARPDAAPMQTEAWINTAFNGELVLPRPLISAANLEPSAGIEATLADGRPVLLETFSCFVNWFGEERPLEVIGNDGTFPLLGVGLLIGHRLVIDYNQATVIVE